MTSLPVTSAIVAALGWAGLALSASAAELPPTIAWTAYDVGGHGYNQAIGIGSALKQHAGVTLRVLPGKNDVSRLAPLRDGKVQFASTGIGSIQAFEGAEVFGRREWGPQPVRVVSMANGTVCAAVMAAGDAGIGSVEDLRGKRVAWIKGGSANNHVVATILAFGGLTWDDVEKVELGGYGGAHDAVINGQVDVAQGATTTGGAAKLAASPRGIFWPPQPHDDEAGWERLLAVSPFMRKHMCAEGAGITTPFDSVTYPYPVLLAYAESDADLAYAMAKALQDYLPHYKDAVTGLDGWALDRQVLDWVIPFHEGVVRYLKEEGRWTPALQEHQDGLLDREQLLAETWKAFVAGAPADDAEFQSGWMAARAGALDQASLLPIWRTWE